MDPNLFHLDWQRTFEVLAAIVVLAFMIERALALIFESRLFIARADRPGIKELIALVVSIAVCWRLKFDALSMIILTAHTSGFGYIVTGAIVAGGSKASMKLFHDVMNIKSSAYDQRYEIQATQAAVTAERLAHEAEEAKSGVVISRLERKIDAALKTAENATIASGTTLTDEAVERTKAARKKVEAVAEKVKR